MPQQKIGPTLPTITTTKRNMEETVRKIVEAAKESVETAKKCTNPRKNTQATTQQHICHQ